jgi:hypothetical protein
MRDRRFGVVVLRPLEREVRLRDGVPGRGSDQTRSEAAVVRIGDQRGQLALSEISDRSSSLVGKSLREL